MKFFITTVTLLIFIFSYGQSDDYLLGKWDFEKMPDHIEIDEEGKEMANLFFKDLSLSLDEPNYTLTLMGNTDSGTYIKVENGEFDFTSNSGTTLTIGIEKLSEEQIIFKHVGKEFVLLKSKDKPVIEIEAASLDKISGIKIDKKVLQGVWFHNGQKIMGKNNGIILKHTEEEIVNYSFLENGDFVNKSPFEITLGGVWNIANDQETLIIDSVDKIERFKVMKLNETELELFNPKNETILLFVR